MLTLVSLRLGACAAEDATFEDLLDAVKNLRQPEKLESLRKVVFETAREVLLFDLDILLLIEAWPHLEVLSINEKCGWKIQPSVTLEGLRCIVKGLPHLKELHIAIDAIDVEPGCDIGHGYPESRYPEFRLDLLDSSIGAEIEDVAAYIGDIFRERELQLDAYQLAWDFHPLPPDLLVENALYQQGWRDVHKLLCEAQDTWSSDGEGSGQSSCSASDVDEGEGSGGEEVSDESASCASAYPRLVGYFVRFEPNAATTINGGLVEVWSDQPLDVVPGSNDSRAERDHLFPVRARL
ncbi:hypothetical protein CONPUDRAFT_159173 [Coniophora puteana RWD-64-598 SS2]|uniref:Uncharacterized protein n=1 Tax=Coniophora puteana (strain RWD-64-598) TaxID=741705 RepID=A0A5M3MAD7_CONPW|nr:uncharacterized protein CONPUDRAFT_159173 [Coniophora puteana RWD-64-598 SS2]EIW75740.1 hypothetical protein CONPUDRAFT_159173 [Coniophora puteana RWD-64-598 SS2]